MTYLRFWASLQNSFMPRFCSLLSTFKRSYHTNPDFTKYFLSVLPFCRNSQDLKALNTVLIVHGLIKNQQPLIKQYIEQCCRLGFPDLALSGFKMIEKSDLSLQNLVLRSLSDAGSFKVVVFFYRDCQRSGLLSDNYTYPFVIKSCAGLGDVCFGELMHSVVLRTGFGENLVVQTALLGFYAKVGEVKNAHKLIDEISQPDLVAWNALISGYSVNGFDYEVFQVFHDMCAIGITPNDSTFASVFPVCSRFGVIDVAISFHALAYKLGYSVAESLVPALISMYATWGYLLAAANIFNTSPRKNVAIWNSMISAYTRNHEPKKAVVVFQKMLLDEVKPNMVTFVSLLPSSENLHSVLYVGSLHAYIVKLGVEKQLSVVTALLSVYAKLGNIDSAEFLFSTMHHRSLLLWNSMVSAYASNEFWYQSLGAFRLMQMDGFDPDAISIVTILSSCSELEAPLLGRSAHAFSIKRGIYINLDTSNALLAFYCNCGRLTYSFRIFDRMVHKSVVSWNTMISGCLDNGELVSAMFLFHEMIQLGVNFDLVTLISILPSCHENQTSVLGLLVHCHAVKTALITDINFDNALVSMYINRGELAAAKLVFNDMPNTNVVSWNAILTGHRYHNLHKETLELFNKMIVENQKPNYITILNVLPSCQTLLQGKSFHGYIYRRMIPLENALLTSLMIMYARFGYLSSCSMLFHMGNKGSISLWNTVMSAHLFSGNSAMAFSFFSELIQNKIEPDHVTVLNLISACVHLKNLQVSYAVMAYLLKKGFDEDVTIANALIDMYAKCGSIPSARTLFEAFTEKDSISWSTMMNAYGLHGDGGAALALYSQMRLLGIKTDNVTYTSILSACSHSGLVEQGRIIFDSMTRDGVLPGGEHYACMVDLLSRTGHLNEAYEFVKNSPHKPSASLLESLLGACLSHGNYGLGEEIGRLLLEMNLKDSGPYVILHNIYAAAGKWLEANTMRLHLEHKQPIKAPGISHVHSDSCMYMSNS